MGETGVDAVFDIAIENSVDWLYANLGGFFNAIGEFVDFCVASVETLLLLPHPFLAIAIVTVIAWLMSGRTMAVFTILGLALCYYMDLWEDTVSTTALVIVATLWTLFIAIPFGIIAGLRKIIDRITRPILDFMQTMPTYIYLIPAILLLGFGSKAAVLAMIVYSLPPAFRLTSLGIKQVPVEYVEAGKSFGGTTWQNLVKIQIPAALPTIMTGVNQCLMLALSGAVIAGMIGAGGLGRVVYKSIMVLDIARSFDAGIAIVILAIIMDRITQGSVDYFNKGPRI